MIKKGFTLIEVVVSLAIFSVILLAILSFYFWINYASSKTKAEREVVESARRAVDIISKEIRSAKSIYSPTTSAGQLSLETTSYLPSQETDSYIDFFLCGERICFKKESQDPVAITSDSVRITSLVFTQLSTNGKSSVKIDLTAGYTDNSGVSSTLNISSAASLRAY